MTSDFTRLIICTLTLALTTACSTSPRPATASVQMPAPPPEPTPTGEFVFGEISRPLLKLKLNADGHYFAEERSLIEFWPMIEGKKVYPQPIRPSYEKGCWIWNRKSRTLALTHDTSRTVDPWYDIARLQFDPTCPDVIATGRGVVLKRVEILTKPPTVSSTE